jgi:hypothetical protein
MAVREPGHAHRRKAQGMHLREIWTQVDADKEQGFDEFMNLVIDDAVEVTLANAKKETSEERRSIGAY